MFQRSAPLFPADHAPPGRGPPPLQSRTGLGQPELPQVQRHVQELNPLVRMEVIPKVLQTRRPEAVDHPWVHRRREGE